MGKDNNEFLFKEISKLIDTEQVDSIFKEIMPEIGKKVFSKFEDNVPLKEILLLICFITTSLTTSSLEAAGVPFEKQKKIIERHCKIIKMMCIRGCENQNQMTTKEAVH